MKTLILSSAFLLLAAAPLAHAAGDPALVKRGEYVAKAADCAACHTVPGGQRFAGGRAVPSPFGDIYASNITPDPDYGIGGSSLADFSRAVREGIGKDGRHLYPAMPYPSYAKVSDADIAALYAYFMNGVKPVHEEAPKTSLVWPFSMRWGVSLWNELFAPSGVSTSATATDPLGRGRYLVEALGHCGACHTPRGWGFQEKAYTGEDADFLAGGTLDDWPTPSLRAGGSGGGIAQWSVDDIVELLQTGRNAHGAVTGEMKLVIADSTAELTDADNRAIATYLKSLPGNQPAAGPAASDATQRLASAKLDLNSGARLYLDNCAACHFADGKGAPPAFPPLAGNLQVDAANPYGMLHVILAGSRLPSTPKQQADIAMPDFGWRLSDEEVASLASFVRSSWGNTAPTVTAEDVAKVRKRVQGETNEPTSGPVFPGEAAAQKSRP